MDEELRTAGPPGCDLTTLIHVYDVLGVLAQVPGKAEAEQLTVAVFKERGFEDKDYKACSRAVVKSISAYVTGKLVSWRLVLLLHLVSGP